MRYGKPPRSMTLNKLSLLSEPKSDLKRSIKERMSFLAACYISLATFVDDDAVDFLLDSNSVSSEERLKRVSEIYKKVVRDMDEYRKEIEDFNLFELPTTSSRDALDS
ncbi:MAG TPA: hypothetical protein VHE10_02450 [Candidatus Paceibacterota bacterium]|nr:hypothetical protein [Candidatus Paceibacterota bacterium]